MLKIKRLFATAILFISAFFLTAIEQTFGQHADRIFINGKIWTADDTQPLAEAIAINGDKILAVGSSERIKPLASPDTAVIDLKGRLVVPGFQDSHLHFPGDSVNSIALDGIDMLEGFQKAFHTYDSGRHTERWVVSKWPHQCGSSAVALHSRRRVCNLR